MQAISSIHLQMLWNELYVLLSVVLFAAALCDPLVKL
jgi:hypothetical protein